MSEAIYHYYGENPTQSSKFDIIGMGNDSWDRYTHRVGSYYGSSDIENALREFELEEFGTEVSLQSVVEPAIFVGSSPAKKNSLNIFKLLRGGSGGPRAKMSDATDEMLYKCPSIDSSDDAIGGDAAISSNDAEGDDSGSITDDAPIEDIFGGATVADDAKSTIEDNVAQSSDDAKSTSDDNVAQSDSDDGMDITKMLM